MGDIEELTDLVLIGQHPKLRERCIVDRIVSVLEDTFGAYDAQGVRAVLQLGWDDGGHERAVSAGTPPPVVGRLGPDPR